jgi:hypothetical protein
MLPHLWEEYVEFSSGRSFTLAQIGITFSKEHKIKEWLAHLGIPSPQSSDTITREAFMAFVEDLVVLAGAHSTYMVWLPLTSPEPRNFAIATIAFINPGAGGGQGIKVIEKLRKLLSPEQVFDLKVDGGPKIGYVFHFHCTENFFVSKILSCFYI